MFCSGKFWEGVVPCTSISLILRHAAILDGIWFALQCGSQTEMRNLMWVGRAVSEPASAEGRCCTVSEKLCSSAGADPRHR